MTQELTTAINSLRDAGIAESGIEQLLKAINKEMESIRFERRDIVDATLTIVAKRIAVITDKEINEEINNLIKGK